MTSASTLPATVPPGAVSGVAGLELFGPVDETAARVLTTDALALVARLARAFEDRRRELLAARTARQHRIRDGEHPDFLPATQITCGAEVQIKRLGSA